MGERGDESLEGRKQHKGERIEPRESVNTRLADTISQSLTADCDRQVDQCQAGCGSLGSDWSFPFGCLVLD